MAYSIKRSLQSVVRNSRFTGLFPFNIEEDGSIIVSIPLLILSILIQSILTLVSVSFFIFRWGFAFKFNFIQETLISLGQFSIQYAQISLIISLLSNKEGLNEAFKTLVNMENVDEPINNRGCLWYPIFCGILLVGSPIMEVAMELEINHFISFEILLIILKWELAYFAIFQFTGLLAVCRMCFLALENRLKHRLRGYSKWEAVERSEQLINCCETINSCYGSMLLIMLISFFGLITTNLYSAYINYKIKSVVFICTLSAFILLTTFHYLVNACTKTADVVNEFNHYIHNSIIQDILTECVDNHAYFSLATMDEISDILQHCGSNHTFNSKLKKEFSEVFCETDEDSTINKGENSKPNATLKKIVFQSTLAMEAVNRKKLEFTACDYFSINYSLFYSMIETSATYLIICIQSYTIEFIYQPKISQENSTEFSNNNDTDFLNETVV